MRKHLFKLLKNVIITKLFINKKEFLMMEVTMVNIFDTLPRNFFNIFNTADRVVISECICVLYEYIKDDASFASLKENLIYELTKYFSSHLIELEELQSQSPRERALYVYRRLKECGWLSEEVGENYHVYARF